MKRYACTNDENGQPNMFESDTGDWYHRDDLIAAGVLVPVLKGDNPGCMHLVKLEDVG